jgi:hypothetical protein
MTGSPATNAPTQFLETGGTRFGRALIRRITARAENRDIPVSDETKATNRAAARAWGAPHRQPL